MISHEINQIYSPITSKIDQYSENVNVQNISNLIEITHNITSFDGENEKESIKFEEKENLIHFDKDENETDISIKKVPLANYMQVMYDQNSERVKKRSQQMRKMKEKLHFENEENENKETNNTENKSRKIPNAKIFLEKEENSKELILEPDNKSITKEINKNEETELVISDLDCPLDEEIPKSNNRHSKNSLSLNLPSKSFIHLTNNLLTKCHAKPENATPDYLLALNQCETEETSSKDERNIEIRSDNHKRFPSVNINNIYIIIKSY